MPAAIGTFLTVAVVVGSVAWAGGRFPWPRRTGKRVDSLHITAHKNTPIALWPKEPESPKSVSPAAFEKALGELCMGITPTRQSRYSTAILSNSRRFGVDPFLLAALMYDQSRCWPHTPKRDARLGRYGLTRIPVAMHAPHIRKGVYKYYVKKNGAFAAKTLDVSDYRFNNANASGAKTNLFFAAAILKVFDLQSVDLQASFEHVPHRHMVSHWFYGDRVRGVEPENRVLTARRRLLAYYANAGSPTINTVHGNPIVSPLDGTPRLVLDYFGNPRGKKGSPGHRGLDIDAAEGEPVRAVAAGRVTFAGVDLQGVAKNRQLTLEETDELTKDEMGPGGLYVSLNHQNHFGTIYMHLETLAVVYNENVAAGQIIGTAGRTGAQKSGPHLHLEFRIGTDREDPASPLAKVLVNPYLDKARKRRLRRLTTAMGAP